MITIIAIIILVSLSLLYYFNQRQRIRREVRYDRLQNRKQLLMESLTDKNVTDESTEETITDDFFQKLVKTINWTEALIKDLPESGDINYSTVLRETNPFYNGKPFYRFENTLYGYPATPGIPFQYQDVLDKAMAIRANVNWAPCDIHTLGQIIRFEIDLTTHDGASCNESEGFVDESDVPPLDTWFYFTKSSLYCWIPSMFIERMQSAIDVEIMGSYNWIRDDDPLLHAQTVMFLKTQKM